MRRIVLLLGLFAAPVAGEEPPQWKRELDRAYQAQQLEQLQRDVADLRNQVDVLRQELAKVKDQHALEAGLREAQALDRLTPEEKDRARAAKREMVLLDRAIMRLEATEAAKVVPGASPQDRGVAAWNASQRAAAARAAYLAAPTARTAAQRALAAEVERELQRLRAEISR